MKFQVVILRMPILIQKGSALSRPQHIKATGGVTSDSGIPKFVGFDYTFLLYAMYETFVVHFGAAYILARTNLLTLPNGTLMPYGTAVLHQLARLKPFLAELFFKLQCDEKFSLKMRECSYFRSNGTSALMSYLYTHLYLFQIH